MGRLANQRMNLSIRPVTTLTFWQSIQSVGAFAGESAVETAKYYPEDRDFLLEFEPTVTHYEIVGQA
jgi:hypothetical protein